MSIASFGVRKPVVANLVMFAIIAAGIMFGINLRREFFPEINPTQVLITAPYPGAAPEEVESSLAIKIEDRVADLRDVKELNSVVSEGMVTIRIEFNDGIDIAEAVADVKRELDALQDLPEDAERIIVNKFEPNLPVIVLSLSGYGDEREMKRAIRAIRDDLRSLPDMGDVTVSGVRRDEVIVEVRPAALLRHRLSLPQIAQQIREAMVEVPGGSVRSATQNVSIRTLGAKQRAAEIRDIVVKAGSEGQILRLRDIADVRDGFVDVDVRVRLNGKPSVSLTVYKVGDEDAVEMAEVVKAYVAGRTGETINLGVGERLKKLTRKPGDATPVSVRVQAYELGQSRTTPLPGELTLTTDLARFIVGRLNLLMRNAAMGGVLVFITLLLLLNWRVSLWVALGLVISLMGTLVVMRLVGITLNLLTMFGLIIVIGILVDDAIVVAENIIARHEQGESAHAAAVSGTNQVAWPVFVTVLTTICAFLPLTLIEGRIGDMLGALPIVVACALSVSLLECLLILPAHMAHSLVKNDERHDAKTITKFEKVEFAFEAGRDRLFNKIIIQGYVKIVRASMSHRYLSVAIAIAAVIFSFGLVVGGRLPFTFLSSADSETVSANLRMPIGTPIEATDETMRRIEAAALGLSEVQSIWTIVGAVSSIEGDAVDSVATHLGQFILELKPVQDRDRTSREVIVAWRTAIGELPGVESFRIEELQGGPSGPPISMAVVGDNPQQLMRVVDELKELIDRKEGVFDVADDSDSGQRELRLRLREGASELGFTTQNIAQQVRGAVYGLEAFTFAGDREDVDVRVMLPEHIRRSIAAVEQLYVFTPDGRAVPLGEVVKIEEAEGYATLRRLDRQRVVTVSADVDESAANTEDITRSLAPDIARILAQNPGIRIIERGRQKDMADSFASLPLGMFAAVGMIFVVLAWLFSSYIQPLIVLSAVPFATIGMIWGHLLLGFDLTILSLIGFIALTGIVVNDSLIFMEFFNQKRREGLSTFDACVEAGRARIRAILLTTITTVLGLLPLMLEKSFQARFLIPMAITISGGLMSATGIILIVLPCFLMIWEDFKWVVGIIWRGKLVPSPHADSMGGAPTHHPVAKPGPEI